MTTQRMDDLRKAIEAPEQESVATVQYMNGVTFGYLDVMQPVGTKLYAALSKSSVTISLPSPIWLPQSKRRRGSQCAGTAWGLGGSPAFTADE